MVGSESFPISEEGIDRLLTFLLGIELTIDRIGVEGSGFLGRPLVLALSAAGYDVREVQANRTAERRKRRRRAKTDIKDAEAIARETLADPHLPPAGKHATPRTGLADARPCSATRRASWSCNAFGCSPRPKPCLSPCPSRSATRCPQPAACATLQLVALADGHAASGGLATADRLQ